MEELQDAIEDAQYVNEIGGDGPRPILPWESPSPEELALWKEKVQKRERQNGELEPFTMEWTVSHALGLFLFSAFVKETCNEYVEMNFVEDVIRWKSTRGKQRSREARQIISKYLLHSESDADAKSPERKEIVECDLERPPPPTLYTEEEMEKLLGDNADPSCQKCFVGLDGPVRDEIISVIEGKNPAFYPSSRRIVHPGTENAKETRPSDSTLTSSLSDATKSQGDETQPLATIPETPLPKRHPLSASLLLPDTFFDEAELVVFETLKKKYWARFIDSAMNRKLMNFLWYQDRKVVEDDFFMMRVLGRGGFGVVTACKKGTSGKLYAMKVMNKKRIKIKKSEQLTLNERSALASVDSPFVVNLKYSFQSKNDLFLILDLMSGGDLSFHLGQKGRFSKKECLYYAARIMLGLQALHDQQYVYRDLKPENCLMAEDGRVKLTDLGLATKITPTLHGAAGTRGYWAPEMLRRDNRGKRLPYGHTVDWFSFGCVLAEFISGTNPFRSEMALNYGIERGMKSKEKAIDCATLEMDPIFDRKRYDEDAADLCRKLLEKNEKTRLGTNGCEEIMAHPWFRDVNWEIIITDRKKPPFVPPKDVNAASQSEIGTFAEDKAFHETVLDEKDDEVYSNWDWTNPRAYAAEVIEFLVYERATGEPLLPIQPPNACCCSIS